MNARIRDLSEAYARGRDEEARKILFLAALGDDADCVETVQWAVDNVPSLVEDVTSPAPREQP